MARIRTIKPEFPHSESMGKVSRDARLTFIQMWTLADDSGRLRGNSRMLASLLFPYDDDAKKLIGGWLTELERERCVIRYVVDGTSYIQICNWLMHQKIDHPSASKFPPFDESSRILASPRENSPRIKEGIKEGIKDMSGGAPDVAPLGKELRKQAAAVIEFLNAKAGRNFDLNGANADHIVARLKEGESIEDCRAVIALKCREWRGDEKMSKYLRPETLFNRTKFATYKGELGAVEPTRTVAL